MMITGKKMALKAVILACSAFLVGFCGLATVRADVALYDLENIPTNGDFQTNVTGWTGFEVTNTWEASQELKSTGTGGYRGVVTYQLMSTLNNHKYYFRSNFTPKNANILYVQVGMAYPYGGLTALSNYLTDNTVTNNVPETISGILTCTGSQAVGAIFIRHAYVSSEIANGSYIFVDNVILIDLTATFGAGYEPTLADFEAYYLPDLNYFESYSSYIPVATRDIDPGDYINLITDLDAVEWTKSLVNFNGPGVTLSIYAKVNEDDGLDFDAADIYVVSDAYDPSVVINGKTFAAAWTRSDYNASVLELDMDADFQTALKGVLFNHYINSATEYINFPIASFYTYNVQLWIVISLQFPLNINVKSFLVSMDRITYGFISIADITGFYAKLYNQDNGLISPVIKVSPWAYDTLQTYLFNDFGAGYTNVSHFDFNINLTGPDHDDDPSYFDFRMYEVNMFAEENVIHINPDTSGIGPIFEPETCEWYQLICQAKNGINEIGIALYDGAGIDGFIAAVQDIFDGAGTVGAFLPAAFQTILIIIFSAAGIGILIVIVTKIFGSGD